MAAINGGDPKYLRYLGAHPPSRCWFLPPFLCSPRRGDEQILPFKDPFKTGDLNGTLFVEELHF